MPSGNLIRWAIVIGLFFAIWKFLLPMVGFGSTASLLLTIPFMLGLVLLLGRFLPIARIPLPFFSSLKIIYVLALIGVPLFIGGILKIPGIGGTINAPVISPGEVITTQASCKDSIVNKNIVGDAATLYINAWNMESSTPYSSAVDLTTNCWVYKNSNSASDFVTATSDTSAANLSGFAVGDVVYIYCGGSSYYTEPYTACVDRASFSVNLLTHAAAATSDLVITGYDNGGSAALTSGVTSVDDYNMTLGASAEDSFYLKLKVNAANKAFNFNGWAVAKMFNISTVKPENTDGRSYTEGSSPAYLSDIAIGTDASDSLTITKSYVPYTLPSPVLLKQWESLKDQFYIKSSANDPVGSCNSTSASIFAVVAIDGTYAKGADGSVYNSFYTHDTSESNVGITETLTSPIGKDNGVLICVN